MNKPPPPSKRKTSKSAIRRSDAPESSRGRDRAVVDTAPPARERRTTAPEVPKSRKNSKELTAQQGAETARPRRQSPSDTKADAKTLEPPSRRDSKANGAKGASAPPRGKRDTKNPPKNPDDGVSMHLRMDAPFRVSGDLPDPDAARYSVIPSPRTKKKPTK
jgi:hypothetical protein